MRRSGRKKTVVKISLDRKLLDIKRMTTELQENLRRVFDEAAIEFVQVAASRVPTLTGQAKAALVNIANSLGLDAGVSYSDPPLSDNMHLYVALLSQGNTPERGSGMGHGEIKTSRSPYFMRITLNVTAAHNDFEYFTYWDNETWGSLEAAVGSAKRHIESNFKAPTARFINDRRI